MTKFSWFSHDVKPPLTNLTIDGAKPEAIIAVGPKKNTLIPSPPVSLRTTPSPVSGDIVEAQLPSQRLFPSAASTL